MTDVKNILGTIYTRSSDSARNFQDPHLVLILCLNVKVFYLGLVLFFILFQIVLPRFCYVFVGPKRVLSEDLVYQY